MADNFDSLAEVSIMWIYSRRSELASIGSKTNVFDQLPFNEATVVILAVRGGEEI